MTRAENGEHWPLIEAQQWDTLEGILTDPDFLDAKVASGHVFALVADFADALAALPMQRPARHLMELLGRAIRRDAAFLAHHKHALFQCLWNLGWWHDQDGDELSTLLETWRKSKDQRDPGFTWVRSLRPPIVPLAVPLLAVWPLPVPYLGRATLVFSAEGERLAAYSPPDEVGTSRDPLLWDVLTGQPLPLEAGLLPSWRDLRLSPDGNLRVETGSWDDPVRLLDTASEQKVCTLSTGGDVIVCATAFSPDGQHIAGAGYGEDAIGEFLVWNLAEARLLIRVHPRESVWAIAFSPDGKHVACGTSDGVEIRDTVTGTVILALPGHEAMVNAVTFSPDGRLLATAGRDCTVRLWAVDRHAPALPRLHPDDIRDLVFSTDGKRLVSRSTNDTTWLWDAVTGTAVANLFSSTGVVMAGGSASGSIFADDRRVLSVADDGGTWNVTTGVPLGTVPEAPRFFGSSIVAFSPGGDRLTVASRHHAGGLTLLDTATWNTLRRFRFAAEVRVLTFSPDGQSVAAGAVDGSVGVWSVDEEEPRLSLEGHLTFVTAMAFSPDGRFLVTAAADRTTRIWDAQTGTQLACLEPVDAGVYSRRVHWDAGKKSENVCYGAQAVAFTPESDSLVTLTDGDRLRWWDWRSGVCHRTVRGVGDFRAIAAGFPWRALVRNGEVVIESPAGADQSTNGGESVAWLPCAPVVPHGQLAAGLHLTTHPGGRIWAGAVGRHLYHFALEGNPGQGVQSCPGSSE
jgi:WD40 repeat protein